MTADTRLLVPLSCLTGVPMGAPMAVDSQAGIWFLIGTNSPKGMRDVINQYGERYRFPSMSLSLDLSPPDPLGSRVDGLDVGLRLLGWEAGWKVTYELRWLFFEGRNGPVFVPYPFDPANPLALRLAVAAVLRETNG